MKVILRGVVTVCLGLIGALGMQLASANPSRAAESRGVKVAPIRDAGGREVGLYRESHALVIGASQYPNGWPKLPGVAKDAAAVQAAAPPKEPRPGDTWTEPGTGMQFVWVPGGDFTMGNSKGDWDEKPEHRVRVNGYWMGKSEVTQGQWKALMESNPSEFSWCGDDCPVENVSWEDTQEYIRRLAARSGQAFRLPTEAEWEYAAREGSAQQKWAGTDKESELGEYAWYLGNSVGKTHPVCTKRANRFGLCDMSGNVWEWCQDRYSQNYYGDSPSDNPVGPPSGSGNVLRGGSWDFGPRLVRATLRIGYGPGYRFVNLGFRLALPPGQR